MARTVLYGGTFNPIHRGHLALCRYLLDSEKFDRILLMPTASPPHKPSPQLAGGQHRLALCRMAVAGLDGITVEDWEIRQGGTSYTVDTLSYLHEKYPSDTFFLLIGSDMFLSFCQWKNWREIAKLATLLVASRTQHDREGLQAQYDLLTAQGVVIQLLENPIVELSSTEVRWEIGNTGRCKEVLPQVLQYCKDYQLYSNKYDLAALRATVQPLESPER
ncbi:MAG: nicotinate (nicotinamide) nucleotide adenylyltransferase, partial [Angelakisella sp.]